MRSHRIRTGIFLAAVVGTLAILTTLILLSPLLMRKAVGRGEDWINLSNVGQAYGGVSAILSGLAFCGIACSIFLQWRQNRLTQLTASRERQFELVKLAMADPDLMFQREEGETVQAHTQKMYYNLWVSHWAMLWELGGITESELRPNFSVLFRNESAREWWANIGRYWYTVSAPRSSKFSRIAEECYELALAVFSEQSNSEALPQGDGRDGGTDVEPSSGRLEAG
jgi:hypothetical protein